MRNLKLVLIGTLALTLLGLPAAPHRAAAQTGMKTYEVTVTNITTSMQGLSPLVIATHPAAAHLPQMGQPASRGLEILAEEGMTDQLATEWKGSATEVATTKAHLLPGDSITVRVNARDGDVLSAATMLIQTNDGFTGLDSVALADGASMDAMAYDAGTEDNTERKSDVPGPPFGGKNSGPATNPPGTVSMHEGIKGTAEVTPEFNWSGPVARFSVRMISTSAGATAPPNTPATTGTGTAPGTAPTTGTAPTSEVLPSAGEMPSMPKTGAGDTAIWLLITALAAVLALAGFALRRATAARR